MEKDYNNSVKNFFIKEQIDVEEILNAVDCNVYSIEEVNPIAHEFGIYKEIKDDVISIGDVIGFESDFQSQIQGRPENVFEGLSILFDKSGNEYQNRSLSMLDYSKEEVIEKLSKSFSVQPIIIKETGEGNYSIAGNGKHRFMLLRAFYLSELAKVKDNQKEIENIKNKYKIPVRVSCLDLTKTYAKYFLMTYGIENIQKVELINDSGKGFENLTSVETNLKGVFGSNEVFILNDNELIKYTKSIIQKNPDIIEKKPPREENFEEGFDKRALEWCIRMSLLKDLPTFYKEIKSFREFFDKHMLDIYLGKNIEIEKKLKDE